MGPSPSVARLPKLAHSHNSHTLPLAKCPRRRCTPRLNSHKNPPFPIALARSRGLDVNFIDTTTGKLGGALPENHKRATGLVLSVDVRKAHRLLLGGLHSQSPLFKLRSLHLHLEGQLPEDTHPPNFRRLNETNLPALRHFGLTGVAFPLEDIRLPNLLTLQVELIDSRQAICALVRDYIGRPLQELWLVLEITGSDCAREAFPVDVEERLGALKRICARLARTNDMARNDTFQRLMNVSAREVQLTTTYCFPKELDIVPAFRFAEALMRACGGLGTPDTLTWTVSITENGDDNFGRPVELNMHALTIRSAGVGLVRRIVFKWDHELGHHLFLLMQTSELEHLEVDGPTMWGILHSVCQKLSIHRLGTPTLTTLTIRVSVQDTSASMERVLGLLQERESIGRVLDGINTLVVRARPFEQVKLEWNDLMRVIQHLQLPREGKVLHVRTAGVWLQRATRDSPDLPPGVTLED